MSAVFDSSTSKLNINDSDNWKSKAISKRIVCLTIILLVLVILSIAFVVLYVKTDQKNEKLKTENSGIFISEVATGGVLQKRCSWKFRKFHRKSPVPEFLFFKNTEHLRTTASIISLFFVGYFFYTICLKCSIL